MGKGKGSKLIWTAVGFALGVAFLGPVAGSAIAAGLMGASLVSSIWMAVNNRPNQNGDSGSADVTRFARSQETMSSNGALPVVYGLRKLSGNQTYHKTDADANTLYKHIVLCEGGIQGIQGVTANDLLVPTGNIKSGTVFTIQNVKYTDAKVWKKGKTLYLYCNGQEKSIQLCNKDDFTQNTEFWEWQTSIPCLIAYINRLNQGWQCFPTATTSKYPGDIEVVIDNTRVLSGATMTTIPYSKFGKLALGSEYRSGNDCYRAATWEEAQAHNYPFIKKTDDGTVIQTYTNEQVVYTWKVESVNHGYCYKNPIAVTAKTVTGGTKFTFHDGDLPNNYEEVGAYPNMAWIEMTCCVADELSNNPSVSCEVFGKKIFDTRTGETAYSTNPAMCLRDFLLSSVYGLGHFITEADLDEDSFKESADYCDELIEFELSDGSIVKAKRYELNIIIDSRRNAWDWVSDILASFSGFIVITQGKLMLKIERPSPIIYSFDETNCSDLKIAPIELEQVPNRYEVTFIDPLNNWDSVKAIVEDSADQHTRGKIITKDVQLEGVTSQNQALRLARFYRDYNASCILNVSFKTGYQALHLQPGDVVKLTYKCFADFPLRINEIKENAEGSFEITGRQYNPSIYNDTLGAPMRAYNYATKDVPLGAVPDIVNLKFKQYFFTDSTGAVHSEIQGTWSPPPEYGYVKAFSIYKEEANGQWNQLLSTTGTSFKTNVVIGDVVRFKVCVMNTNDTLSNGVVSNRITIDGVDYPPDTITGLTITFVDEQLHIAWDANTELDFKQYIVTVNGSTFTTIDNSIIAFAVDGTNEVTVQAEDYNGGKSDKTVSNLRLDLAPSNVMGFKVENFGNYNVLSWYPSEKATYYEIGGSITKEIYGGCSLLIPITTAGGYSYNIRAVNRYGASSISTASVMVASIEARNNIMSVNLLQDITCDESCRVTDKGTLSLIY